MTEAGHHVTRHLWILKTLRGSLGILFPRLLLQQRCDDETWPMDGERPGRGRDPRCPKSAGVQRPSLAGSREDLENSWLFVERLVYPIRVFSLLRPFVSL